MFREENSILKQQLQTAKSNAVSAEILQSELELWEERYEDLKATHA